MTRATAALKRPRVALLEDGFLATIAALFVASFLAATLLPGGSEAMLAALVLDQPAMSWVWLAVATVGNTLGSLTSWVIGRILRRRLGTPAGLKPAQRRALERLQKWGAPALLLAWLPVVGDPLCLAAGWLGTPWLPTVLYVAMGKAARYLLLVWALL
jgi:membrane protein YqaA with SNARE-associated domain